MPTLQRLGGGSAIVAATTFIAGFALYIALLLPARYGSMQVDPARHVAFLLEHQSLLYAWNLVIYVPLRRGPRRAQHRAEGAVRRHGTGGRTSPPRSA